MKTVIIDNYDSFTYNLRHILRELGAEVDVLRNDQFDLDDLEMYDKIVLSPGPGIPSEAGLLLDVIRRYAPTKPILGVCLGEQAIAEAFGGKLINLAEVFHGVQTPVTIVDGSGRGRPSSQYNEATHSQSTPDYIFEGLPGELVVGRYHSWVVDGESLPDCLEVTATSPEGYVMALKHKDYDVHGIQFHPESVLTPLGREILSNFLKR